jgi:hypothetical protein
LSTGAGHSVERIGLDAAAASAQADAPNMGCGFAVYCAKGSGEHVVALAEELDLTAILAGHVEAGDRRVILEFDDSTVEYDSGAMDLNPRKAA